MSRNGNLCLKEKIRSSDPSLHRFKWDVRSNSCIQIDVGGDLEHRNNVHEAAVEEQATQAFSPPRKSGAR